MTSRPFRIAGFVALAVFLSTAARAEVIVRFVEPERYTDAENRFGSGVTLRVTLGEIRRLLETQGSRVLRHGETLTVDVLDIDLAGFEQPGANFPTGLRIVRDITPPRFRLRYVLSERGRRVLAGEDTVTDQNFLLTASRLSTGTFAYETVLLRDWLRRRFAER